MTDCSALNIPSVTVTVATYDDWVSKSAPFEFANVSAPILEIDNSEPDTEYIRVSPSKSVAIIFPINTLFSSTLKPDPEEIIGELSFTFITLTVISWVSSNSPSLTVTIAVYEVLVS